MGCTCVQPWWPIANRCATDQVKAIKFGRRVRTLRKIGLNTNCIQLRYHAYASSVVLHVIDRTDLPRKTGIMRKEPALGALKNFLAQAQSRVRAHLTFTAMFHLLEALAEDNFRRRGIIMEEVC